MIFLFPYLFIKESTKPFAHNKLHEKIPYTNISDSSGYFREAGATVEHVNKSAPLLSSIAWSEGFKKFVDGSRPEYGFHYYDPGIRGPPPMKSKNEELIERADLLKPQRVLFIGCRVWTFPTDFDVDDINHIYSVFGEVRAQNLDRSKLTIDQSNRTVALPLGVDFHSLDRGKVKVLKQYSAPKMPWQKQLNDLLTVRFESTTLRDRNPRILATWSRNRSTSARHEKDGYLLRPALYDQARSSPLFDFITGSRIELWRKMSQYVFVFSPIGNGLDCFRFWEALALGCIVIVQKNPVAAEFASCFPVIQVDDLLSIREGMLTEWHRSLESTSLNKLAITNWLQTEYGSDFRCD